MHMHRKRHEERERERRENENYEECVPINMCKNANFMREERESGVTLKLLACVMAFHRCLCFKRKVTYRLKRVVLTGA